MFDSSREVAAAILALEQLGTPTHRCTVVAHKGGLERLPTSELELFETGAAAMGLRLTGLGAVVGAALGALAVGPLGLLAAGPLAAILLGTAAGSTVGAFTGVIAGATDYDSTVEQMAKGLEEGKVLLAIEPTSWRSAEDAETLLRNHHAHLVHRHSLQGPTLEERDEIRAANART